MMDTTNQGEVAANPLYSESETEEDNSLHDEMEAELQDDTMQEKNFVSCLREDDDDNDFSEDDKVILNFK